MSNISLSLPYPPSLNTYYRVVNGRILISAPGRLYRKTVIDTLWGRVGSMQICVPTPLAGDISMSILSYPPDRRKRDLDNMLKALLDALQYARIYKDDSQISKLSIERMPSRKNDGIVLVTIGKLNR